MPNATDPGRQYNYTFQSAFEQPRNDQVLRVDWNVAPRTTFYSRLNFGYEAFKGGWGFVLNNANWPQLPIAYEIHSYGIVNTVLHTFNPTTVMEVTVGLNHGKQTVEPLTPADLQRNDRTQVGLSGLPQFFPEANPDNIVPNANFGAAGLALANLPQLGVEGRYPFFGENDIWNSSVNLTKVAGSHNMKAGLFFEYTTRPAARSSQFNGTFNFNRDTNNPLDTNHPFANALIGSVQSYSEATGHPIANAQFANVEWFLQDNWRVSKNLTIDAGVRFYKIGPTKSQGDDLAVFLPDQYNPAAAPALIQPVSTPQGRRGRNPITGEIVPAVKIGTFAQGSGDPTNGIEVFHESVMDTPAIQVAPRVGFSWDVKGDGKTAVRGGFGVFPDRFNDDIVLQHVELPPLVNTPTRQLHDHPRAARDAAQPEPGPGPHAQSRLQAAVHLQLQHRRAARPRVEAGRRLLLRRLEGARSCCRRATSTRCRTARTSCRRASTRRPAARCRTSFLRPYLGYADILFSEFAGFSNYDALQMQVSRRYTAGLRFGASYTFAKTQNVGIASPPNNNPTVNPFLAVEDRNYGDAGRRHNLAVDYSYQVPNLSEQVETRRSPRSSSTTGKISGVTTALSGAALGISYSISGVSDLTGGAGAGVDSRVDIICDPNLSRGDRDVAAGLRHRVLRAAVAGHQPRRHGARRRGHRARLPELGHLVHPQHPARRRPAGCSSGPSCTTRSTTSSSRTSTPPPSSTPPGSRPTPSSGSTRRRGRRGGSCSPCAPCSERRETGARSGRLS